MNDVAYRLNTSNPVIKYGTVVVNNGSRINLKATASGSVFYRDNQVTMPDETPGNTGMVNRLDDYTYYSA